MENNVNKEEVNSTSGNGKQEPENEKSWIERNLWMIAVFAAIFLLRMCSQLSH